MRKSQCFIGLLPAFILFTLAVPANAELRTFTSPDGRTLSAEIVGATPDQVTLKLANGQTLVAALNRFIDADRQFVETWRKQNPSNIKYAFSVNYTKEKKSSSESTRNNVIYKTDTWFCKMKIANRSGQTLEGVQVEYDIFYTDASEGRPVLRKRNGRTTIATIKHLEELVLPTETVDLTTSTLEGGYYYADGTRSRQKDALEGMIVALKHNGKEVARWVSPGVPKDRVPVPSPGAATSSSGQ